MLLWKVSTPKRAPRNSNFKSIHAVEAHRNDPQIQKLDSLSPFSLADLRGVQNADSLYQNT
eukprot:5865331-Amphidinium_carterae.1